MAGIKRFPNGTIQFTIKRAGVLDRPVYLTYPQHQEQEARAYIKKVEALLARGIVPPDLVAQPQRPRTVRDLVRVYEYGATPSRKDRDALGVAIKAFGSLPLDAITTAWVDEWIAGMKRVERLAPSSIRARVGALARCCDWGMRKGYLSMPDHPLRTLPDGYSQYSQADEEAAGVARRDVERDRRLEPGEHERIMAVIESGELPRRQRPLRFDSDAIRLLYMLALESAMRLREMYTLTLAQVDLTRRTVFLERTKNGDKRQVPLTSVAVAEIERYLAARGQAKQDGLLLPFWSGSLDERELAEVSDRLSKLFHNPRSPGIFDVAGCRDLKFHDLRHEATSRLFERTTLSEAQIMKITGHKSHRMMMRYANLRGSDLAARLW